MLYSLHAAYEFFRGAALDAEGASFPRAPVPFAPLIVFGRAKVVYPLLRDLTSAGVWMGFEVVLFTTPDAARPVLFGSRESKLAFFAALKKLRPEIRIYRSV